MTGDGFAPVRCHPADFRIGPQETADTVIAVNPWHLRDVGGHALWDEHAPRHGQKSFQGNQYPGVGGNANSEQKLTTRDMAWKAIFSDWTRSTIGFVGPNGEFRIRVEGALVDLGEPSTWEIRDEESIAFYGERVFERENF